MVKNLAYIRIKSLTTLFVMLKYLDNTPSGGEVQHEIIVIHLIVPRISFDS